MKIFSNIAIFLLVILSNPVFSQGVKRLNIISANSLTGIDNKFQKMKKLVGNVIIEHEGGYMYCDSAIQYERENYFMAYGNVRLTQGGSISVRGRTLHYNMQTKVATIDGNVKLSDNEMQLSTSHLVYNMDSKKAFFNSGATITDSSNNLKSKKGYYDGASRDMYFIEDVVLTNLDFTLVADSLKYNTSTRLVTFLGPTTITGEDTKIYCEAGWYNTLNKQSEFRKNAYIFSKQRKIYGERLNYNIETGDAQSIGYFSITDTLEKTCISGKYSNRIEKENSTYVTDSAMFVKYLSNDTLYLHADTLKLIKDSISGKEKVLAYHHVKAFSSGFRVKCDSMVYNSVDSIIHFFSDPVMWQENNQITANEVSILTSNDDIDKMYLTGNAFMVEKVDSIRFNQVKGKNMIGYFEKNELINIDTEGNAESVYFLTDELNKYIGRNNIQASFIKIYMKDKKIKTIKFIVSPIGNVEIPKNMDDASARLKGFVWREEEKPNQISDIFIED